MHLLANSFSSLFFPAHCLHCKGPLPLALNLLCPSCFESLELINPHEMCPICFIRPCICKKETLFFDRQAFCFDYEGPAKSLLIALKYGDRPYLAKSLASFMLLQLEQLGWNEPDIITYIPQSFLRASLRGYNQSALLATHLGHLMKKPVKKLLKRTTFTLSQTMLPKEDRKELALNTFAIQNEREIEAKHVLLIDDVRTSGATIECASKTLRLHKPRQLDVLCLLYAL